MSDSASMLLVQGIGFAKEGNKQEARTFLEWALRSEPDSDQRARAWLWLSRVTDDPREKRNYLEEILARDLTHVEARRELALLTTNAEPDQPAGESPAPASYTCPTCGGSLAFDPRWDALACPRCGYRRAPDAGDGSVDQTDFLATSLTPRGHRWDLPVDRVLSCPACGATFSLPSSRVAGTCPFCGTSGTAPAGTPGDLVEPEAVLPFKVQLLRVRTQVRDWLTAQRFRPGDLDQSANLRPPQAVYLPFWAFDISGSITWRARVPAGRGSNASGGWETYSDSCPVAEYDVLVPGSHTLPEKQAQEIGAGFDLKDLRPYTADLLAGWAAEVYQVPLVEASITAREVAFERTRGRLEADVKSARTSYPGLRDMTWSTSGMAVFSYKLVLLPVWTGEYRYRGNRYQVAVNGQTGSVSGDVPRGPVQRLFGGVLGLS